MRDEKDEQMIGDISNGGRGMMDGYLQACIWQRGMKLD